MIRARKEKISDVRIIGKVEVSDNEKSKSTESRELLNFAGKMFADLGKLLFAGVLIDRFFNSSEITAELGFSFWVASVAVFLILGFILVYFSIRERS